MVLYVEIVRLLLEYCVAKEDVGEGRFKERTQKRILNEEGIRRTELFSLFEKG